MPSEAGWGLTKLRGGGEGKRWGGKGGGDGKGEGEDGLRPCTER